MTLQNTQNILCQTIKVQCEENFMKEENVLFKLVTVVLGVKNFFHPQDAFNTDQRSPL